MSIGPQFCCHKKPLDLKRKNPEFPAQFEDIRRNDSEPASLFSSGACPQFPKDLKIFRN
jgi:hypothetical protein